VLGGRYRYNCGDPELTGGIVDLLLPLVIGLVFGFMFGVAVGYSVRERISRRRRAAFRAAAEEERYRELDGNQTLPRLE
jgi:hypothetical protein